MPINLPDWAYIAILALVLVILKFFSRPLIGLAVRLGLVNVGKMAMEKQMDQIHLIRRDGHAWKNAPAVRAFAQPLLSQGFSDVGTYALDTLPDVMVQLFTKVADSLYAVIYEHPKAGVWMNYVALFQDGGSITFTTQADRGLEQRPGHTIVYAPGSTADALYRRALSERPQKFLKPTPPESIVPSFERAYAEGMAWRRQKGISNQEVLNVMKTRR